MHVLRGRVARLREAEADPQAASLERGHRLRLRPLSWQLGPAAVRSDPGRPGKLRSDLQPDTWRARYAQKGTRPTAAAAAGTTSTPWPDSFTPAGACATPPAAAAAASERAAVAAAAAVADARTAYAVPCAAISAYPWPAAYPWSDPGAAASSCAWAATSAASAAAFASSAASAWACSAARCSAAA